MTVTLAPSTVDSGCDDVVVGLDPEADVGFFSMSPASAEQVTVQIRTVLDRAWEFIALAYKGRAFLALGYTSWDEYVDARLGDLRLAVPREHRTQVVATLAGARMSVRAIAKLLGVGVATVHRELVRSAGVPIGTAQLPDCSSTMGRDGKSYPRNPRATSACPTCGEVHPDRTADCPWDLFAQGLGPHPGGGALPVALGEWEVNSTPADPAVSKTGRRMTRSVRHPVSGGPGVPQEENDGGGSEAVVDDLLGRLEGLVQGVSDFVGLVTLFETLSTVEVSSTGDRAAVAARIRELTSGVRDGIAHWPSLVDRLERVATALHSHC